MHPRAFIPRRESFYHFVFLYQYFLPTATTRLMSLSLSSNFLLVNCLRAFPPLRLGSTSTRCHSGDWDISLGLMIFRIENEIYDSIFHGSCSGQEVDALAVAWNVPASGRWRDLDRTGPGSQRISGNRARRA